MKGASRNVIPAQAGIQAVEATCLRRDHGLSQAVIPAYAGIQKNYSNLDSGAVPVCRRRTAEL